MGLGAMRRGHCLRHFALVHFALVLACASACAQGVSLEGSDGGATLATTGMGTTAGPPPTTGVPPASSDEGTTEPEGTTTTTGVVPTTDGSDESGSSTAGDDTTTGPEPPHPELYPFDRVHSPITAFVAERMRAVVPQPDTVSTVFAKVGGTTSASPSFFKCLATDAAIMELPPELEATRAFFNVDLGNGVTPFSRDSLAAMPGWASGDLRTAPPTPVASELMTIHPRFAHVLVGSQDLASDQPAAMFAFADNLLDVVDELIAGGAVPILSTIPQRTDMPLKTAFVPRYNAIIRAAAQGRQVPLVDLELALQGLPMTGLAADGVDLSVFNSAMVDRPCFFDEVGRTFGYNVRNLEALRALDRARAVVVDDAPELDPPQPGLAGAGTVDDPYIISSLPFVDLRDTSQSASDVFAAYTGACDPTKDESGPEVVYELAVEAPVDVRVLVFDRGAVDVDIHVLDSADPATCLKRNDREVTGPLPEGEYTIVVDSFAGEVMNGAAGEYILVVLAD